MIPRWISLISYLMDWPRRRHQSRRLRRQMSVVEDRDRERIVIAAEIVMWTVTAIETAVVIVMTEVVTLIKSEIEMWTATGIETAVVIEMTAVAKIETVVVIVRAVATLIKSENGKRQVSLQEISVMSSRVKCKVLQVTGEMNMRRQSETKIVLIVSVIVIGSVIETATATAGIGTTIVVVTASGTGTAEQIVMVKGGAVVVDAEVPEIDVRETAVLEIERGEIAREIVAEAAPEKGEIAAMVRESDEEIGAEAAVTGVEGRPDVRANGIQVGKIKIGTIGIKRKVLALLRFLKCRCTSLRSNLVPLESRCRTA
jgi:hypothetical protein